MGNSLVAPHGNAIAADKRIKELLHEARVSWVKLGVAIVVFHDKGFYKQLGFTFDDWVEKTIGHSKETVYRCMHLVRELEKGVVISEIEKISKDNCEVLVRYVPEPKRFKPELIKAAQELSKPEFVQVLKDSKNHWEPATKDEQVRIIIQCESSLKVLWEGSIALALKRGARTNNQAIEFLCQHYLTCKGETE